MNDSKIGRRSRHWNEVPCVAVVHV